MGITVHKKVGDLGNWCNKSPILWRRALFKPMSKRGDNRGMILLLSHCILGLRNGIKRFQMGDENIDLTSSIAGSTLSSRIQGANSGLSLHFANPDG